MSASITKNIFRYQIWHLLSVIVLVTAAQIIFANDLSATNGALWNIKTKVWFQVAIAVPICHQVYVWLIWRLELYKKSFTSRWGLEKAFKIYSVGFALLIVSRFISILLLALSNQDSLPINRLYVYFLSVLIIPIVIYLFYSVIRYFTIRRALGIDHFDKDYNEPFVKKGIFQYTNNGMYLYGFLALYLPGLLLLSKTALIVALFNHLYIWVHYYGTERPDMKEIYP